MCAWWRKFVTRNKARAAETPPQAAVLRPTPKKRATRRVTIGLDFGTSTSKCCFREEAEGKSLVVLGHDAPFAGASQVLWPTSAAVREGAFVFGYEAETSQVSEVVRSFKMCLLCQARAAAQAASSDGNSCANCMAARPGHLRFGEFVLSAEELSTLYLAVVLGAAKRRVLRALDAKPGDVRFVVNSAAPLDQMSEFGEVGEHFENALYYAWALADLARQHWPAEEALSALQRARQIPRPAVEDSPTRIFPETHAAMTAYLLLPESDQGLYGLLDIGAGTSDVAFFWLQKGEASTTAWYYSAGSARVGMDDIDQVLAKPLNVAACDARAAREALDYDEIQVYEDLIKPIADRVYRHSAEVLYQAMRLDQRPHAWFSHGLAKYRLFLVGGGSMCEPMTKRIERQPPRHMAEWEEAPESLSIPSRTRVMLPSGETVPLKSLGEPHAARLLLLACGLSYRRADIPKYERDKEGVQYETKEPEIPVEFTGHWW